MRNIIERAVRLTAAQRKKRGQIAKRTAKRRAFRRKQKEKKKNTDDDGRNASGFDATLVPSGKLYERWE